jgi:hypothetical protein
MAAGLPNSPIRKPLSPAGSLKSLNASTAIGAGRSFDLGGAHRFYTVQAQITRASTTTSPTTVSVRLQGSLNGTIWHNLVAATNATTSGVMFNSTASHAVTQVRLNSTAKGTGAGAFTVSGWIGVAGE